MAAVTPLKTRDFEARVKDCAREQLRKLKAPLTGALHVKIEFHFHCRHPRPFHTQRPDLDNLIKAVTDALTGIVWVDDCQIDALTTAKKFTQGEDYIYLWVSDYAEENQSQS